MSSFFKDLIGKSYNERSKEEENINPLDRENLFSEVPSIGLRSNSTDAASTTTSVCCVLILDRNRRVTGQTIKIDNRIEEVSKHALDTFNYVLREAFKPHMSAENQSIGEFCAKSSPIKDYSMLIVELSKVLEIELNKSVVLWLRRQPNVEEPASFKDIMCAMKGNNVPDDLREAFLADEDTWDKLRISRNKSAHTGIVSEEIFKTYYDNFCELIERGWFTQLMDLKQKLREETRHI